MLHSDCIRLNKLVSMTVLPNMYDFLSFTHCRSDLHYMRCADAASKLEGVQREGLALCLGTIGASGRSLWRGIKCKLEVRHTELSLRETAWILSKDADVPIRSFLENWLETEKTEQYSSPFGKMLLYLKDIKAEIGHKQNLTSPFKKLIPNHQQARMPESSMFFKDQDKSWKRWIPLCHQWKPGSLYWFMPFKLWTLWSRCMCLSSTRNNLNILKTTSQ